MAIQKFGPRVARRTGERLHLNLTEREYERFDDGSLRRRFPKVRGKAAVKAAKRERQRTSRGPVVEIIAGLIDLPAPTLGTLWRGRDNRTTGHA